MNIPLQELLLCCCSVKQVDGYFSSVYKHMEEQNTQVCTFNRTRDTLLIPTWPSLWCDHWNSMSSLTYSVHLFPTTPPPHPFPCTVIVLIKFVHDYGIPQNDSVTVVEIATCCCRCCKLLPSAASLSLHRVLAYGRGCSPGILSRHSCCYISCV